MDSFSLEYNLFIYGSSVNGLIMRGNSDLDLSLVIHNLPREGRHLEKNARLSKEQYYRDI
jgi:hypothetical protein